MKKEKEAKKLNERYPKGTRVKLIKMDDFQAPAAGTYGTVTGVDDAGQIHINWDNGSSLAVIPEIDKIIIKEKPDCNNILVKFEETKERNNDVG